MFLFRTLVGIFGFVLFSAGANAQSEAERLSAALLGETPLIDDLQYLTDHIGGRPTGSTANEESVAWAVSRFEAAGVSVEAQPFEMPAIWLEERATGRVTGDADYSVDVAGRLFSDTTDPDGMTAPLVDAGRGTAEDFARLGDAAQGAFALVEVPILNDERGLAGLFEEYVQIGILEPIAAAAGVRGIIYMGSRPNELLYRHNQLAEDAGLITAVMAREDALRSMRLLRGGAELNLTLIIEADERTRTTSHNVIAEIPGSDMADEIVLIGAHLDSHDLGTGALDNGSNVTLVIDVARQMARLGLEPRRTIRFALWNGEEQNLNGSRAYVAANKAAMDRHIMATSIDIGTGAIRGFFTSGRTDVLPLLEASLQPVAEFGPFEFVPVAISGTDHFDFFLEGTVALVGLQDDANYASNYHAASDTFDKVDQQQLKINAAIVGAMLWGFANTEQDLPRLTRPEIQDIIMASGLDQTMKAFNQWDDWISGRRGRSE